MTRLLISVEGETEEQFVNGILRPHLGAIGFHDVSARLIGKPRSRRRRGGICNWAEAKSDLSRYLKDDANINVAIMVDYYALPVDWPGRVDANTLFHDHKIAHICESLVDDLARSFSDLDVGKRFFPCILMHEFETLLFSDCDKFAAAVNANVASAMTKILADFGDPEMINDSIATKPSKRIENLIPGYRKPLFGYVGASGIGLPIIRSKCLNFGKWLSSVERIIKQ
jgi:Domain of unknown function (DUF4276)